VSSLPTSLLKRLHEHAAAHLQGQCRQEHLWKGRAVKVVDGTGCSMPDTPGNQALYPQPGGQKPGCGFPVAQLVGLFCLASGALLEFAKTELKRHELPIFLCELLNHLLPGDIVLGDRAYCAYVSIGLLLERSVDCVFRLHQARPVDFRRGRYVAKDDRLITWHKPKKCPPYLTEEEFAGLPQTLRLRQVRFYVREAGFRTQKVVLITTLLDYKAFPAADLAALYARRWEIELSFRDIKISLGMDVLRCKSPAMVEKEIYIHLIGYNLIRTIMLEASGSFLVPLSRMSFKGSLDAILHWAETIDALRDKPRRKAAAIDQMLKAIATDPVPERPNREEPRVKKRRPKSYQWMTKPRAIMRVSASRKRK